MVLGIILIVGAVLFFWVGLKAVTKGGAAASEFGCIFYLILLVIFLGLITTGIVVIVTRADNLIFA